MTPLVTAFAAKPTDLSLVPGAYIVEPRSVGSLCLYACLCTTCIHGTLRSPTRESDTLELKLQTVVIPHVDSGNQTSGFWKSSFF